MNSDILIIGGSLAGGATAITAARAGLRVVVVDKARFPRRKGCGEGLSGRGMRELAALGVPLDASVSGTELSDENPINLPYTRLKGYRIWCGRILSQIMDRSGLVGIPRSVLDSALLDVARGLPTVEVLQGRQAWVREWEPQRFVVEVGDAIHRCRALVIADGAQSPTLHRAGVRAARGANARLGISSVWGGKKGEIPSAVSVILRDGGEVYVTPVGAGLVNISALGTRKLISELADVSRFNSMVLSLSEQIGAQLEMHDGPIGCGAIGSAYRAAIINGAFVVGDACETFDPCSGMGMTHAILSGRLAGEALVRAFETTDLHRELIRYEEQRVGQIRSIRGFTSLSRFSMTTSLGRLCLPLFAASGVARMVAEAVHGKLERGASAPPSMPCNMSHVSHTDS